MYIDDDFDEIFAKAKMGPNNEEIVVKNEFKNYAIMRAWEIWPKRSLAHLWSENVPWPQSWPMQKREERNIPRIQYLQYLINLILIK
jgi:hypothetical protein